MKKIFNIKICGLIIVALMFSCVDSTYDNNVQKTATTLLPTMTIAQFQAKLAAGTIKSDTTITDSVYIMGTVVSSDKESNFYKELYLQDSTGAICIAIERYGLYLNFLIGNQYVVKLKGLGYISQYTCLGIASGTETRIPPPLLDEHFFWAGLPSGKNIITPPHLRIAQINNYYLNHLVTIDSVKISEAGETYAYPDDKDNRGYKSCTLVDKYLSAPTMILYNSSYGNFARDTMPSGYHSVTGVITDYSGSVATIVIRNKDDIKNY